MSATTAQTFRLPDLGEGLTEAEIVRWLVAVGDDVALDQLIVEVETAKSIVEVPSPYAGRVAILHGEEGQTVDVGKPLITIDTTAPAVGAAGPQCIEADPVQAAQTYREEERAGSGNVLIGYGTPATGTTGRRRRSRSQQSAAQTPPATVEGSARAAVTRRGLAATPGSQRTEPARTGAPRVISPLVRALARDNNLQLNEIVPTGVGGVITRADVESRITLVTSAAQGATPSTGHAADQAAAVAGPGERRIPLTGFRKAVAATLSRSRSEIPEATVWVDVDATALHSLREAARTATDPGPGLMAYLARFAVAALKQYPVLNARIDTTTDEIVELDSINLGIAVQSQRGLVVPAVLDAHTMSTARLDEEIRAVTARARDGRSSATELTAGTFTLNNYGGFRVDGSAAIINHPQVAILGFGRILDRPWVVDGQIEIRKITQMSFVFDHRVCDGGTAAGFMRSVADAVENPASAIARL